MPPEMLFDYMAVRLNGPKAVGRKIFINIHFTDLDEHYGVAVENAVLNHGKPFPKADATLSLDKATMDALQLKQTSFDEAIAKGDLKIDGDRARFEELMGLLDTFPFWFNIVTP